MASTPESQPINKGWIHKGTPSPRRAAAPTRLGAIDENGGMSPDVPPRSHQRPMTRVLNFAFPPTLHSSRNPPPYTEYTDVTGPNGEKFADLRRNHRPQRRGGFVRLAVCGVIFLAVIIALAVGLGVGLTRKKSSNNSSYKPPSGPTDNSTFPAGAYTFTTFLSVISTACTANPATWRCYPYQTYNESTTASMTAFNWVISPGESSSTYSISSSDNPFALTFSNATLSLTDAQTASEAYTFEVAMDKIVIPSVALTSDNAATQCYYNQTTFSAKLFTKKQKTYPNTQGTTSDPNPTATYGEWPYAVEVQQWIDGGSQVPDCYKINNGVLGEHVSVGTEAINESCECLYENYGT